MPQRAILDGDVSVLAFETSSDHWAGLTASYDADKLILPCCGTPAIPKENARGTRYFSHKPYRRKDCDWKLVGDRHEELLIAIAEEAKRRGWQATTEYNTQECRTDILLEHSGYKIKIAIQLEFKSRPDVDILREQSDLRDAGIWVYHFFSKRRSQIVYGADNSAYVSSGKNTNTIAEVLDYTRRLLDNIDRPFHNLKQVSLILDNNGNTYETVYENGLPASILVNDNPVFNIDIRKKVDITIPDRLPIDQKKSVAYQQKTYANLFKDRLEQGITLYWNGYPHLKSDTFDRLKIEISETEKVVTPKPIFVSPRVKSDHRPKQSNWEYQTSISSAAPTTETIKSSRRPANVPIRPLINLPIPNIYYNRALNNEMAEVPNFNEYGQYRANHIQKSAYVVMEAEEADIWLNTPNKQLRGLSPYEAANWDSDTITVCDTLLRSGDYW